MIDIFNQVIDIIPGTKPFGSRIKIPIFLFDYLSNFQSTMKRKIRNKSYHSVVVLSYDLADYGPLFFIENLNCKN